MAVGARNRPRWRHLGEAYVQQWTSTGWYDDDDNRPTMFPRLGHRFLQAKIHTSSMRVCRCHLCSNFRYNKKFGRTCVLTMLFFTVLKAVVMKWITIKVWTCNLLYSLEIFMDCLYPGEAEGCVNLDRLKQHGVNNRSPGRHESVT